MANPQPYTESAPTTAPGPKSESEIACIAAAAELASIGQAALRTALRVGASEIELWGRALAEMERAGDGDVLAEVDLMSGERTAQVGLSPSERPIRAGDPVLFDLAPLRNGWWADSCATLCCGKPGAALVRRHDAVLAALERGLATARPGATAGEVDAAIRAVLDREGLACPHHTGHGVGASPQELPWLIPQDETVLEEGMIIALEPGAYSDGFGVRLEHLAVIEEGGARPLTTHDLDLT